MRPWKQISDGYDQAGSTSPNKARELVASGILPLLWANRYWEEKCSSCLGWLWNVLNFSFTTCCLYPQSSTRQRISLAYFRDKRKTRCPRSHRTSQQQGYGRRTRISAAGPHRPSPFQSLPWCFKHWSKFKLVEGVPESAHSLTACPRSQINCSN